MRRGQLQSILSPHRKLRNQNSRSVWTAKESRICRKPFRTVSYHLRIAWVACIKPPHPLYSPSSARPVNPRPRTGADALRFHLVLHQDPRRGARHNDHQRPRRHRRHLLPEGCREALQAQVVVPLFGELLALVMQGIVNRGAPQRLLGRTFFSSFVNRGNRIAKAAVLCAIVTDTQCWQSSVPRLGHRLGSEQRTAPFVIGKSTGWDSFSRPAEKR